MTIRAAMDSTTKEKAGRRRMRLFVVPLRVSRNDGKEQRLLPHGRLAGAIKPGVGRLARTTKGGNDHGGGIRSERFSEGHAGILTREKKSAMQKKDLAKRPQCRHIARMSDTNYRNRTATENAANPHCQIEMEWTGKDGRKYRSSRYWMNEGWSNSFMQVLTPYGWQTAY